MPSIVQTGAAAAFVSVEKTVMDADGADSCGIAITLVSDEGADNPLVGVDAADIVVSVSGTGNTVTQPTGTTNASGAIGGASFVTTVEETKAVTVTVAGLALTEQPTVDAGGTITPPASGDPFFEDDFAGPALNDANGFTWTASRNTTPVVFDGHNCVEFEFDGNWAEQRFNLGRNITEAWFEYYLHIPENFAHANPGASSNNKFFRLWGDDYNAPGKVGASSWFSDSFASGSAMRADRIPTGTCCIGPSGSPDVEFAREAERGVWTRVRHHYRYASGAGVDDAIIQIWFGDDLRLDWQNLAHTYEPPSYWNQGYLFGAANAAYAAATLFHVRAFKVYDTDPGWT